MAEGKHTGNPGNFAEDREKASRAGQIGGQHSSGNFAHNPERAAEAGRKGGQASHGGTGAHPQPTRSQNAVEFRLRIARRRRRRVKKVVMRRIAPDQRATGDREREVR